MLAITSILVAIMHALLTRCVYLAFFMFTFYDLSLWLEKLAQRLYYCFLGGIAPVTVAPRRGQNNFSE